MSELIEVLNEFEKVKYTIPLPLNTSQNGGMLQVTGRLMSGKTTKALAATTDYAAEDVLSEAASGATAYKFPNIVLEKNGAGVVVGVRILCSATGLTFLSRLYLFDANPTSNLNDNAANTALLAADLQQYLGYVNIPTLEDLGGYSEAIVTQNTPDSKLPLPFVITSGGRDIYAIHVTREAITGETAGMTITPQLFVELY